MEHYNFQTKPVANKDAIVQGPNYRFTILTDRLIRYEWADDGQFEDRASTFAINRDLPVPKFRVHDNEDEGLDIVTDYFNLSYDKKKFSTTGLLVDFSAKTTDWGAQWRFGKADRGFWGNLGGTARTLDEVDGRCDMGEGVISRTGYAAIDDSKSMIFENNGWVAGRKPGDRVDGYLFGYGHDYRAAIRALYALSGKQPVLPRWALGNWWSRYYAYTQDEYLGLMDKFKAQNIPLSVAVIDMDWHLVADSRVPHAGWTGYTWDEKLFPDPALFGRELHSRNLKITLNDHPHSGVHHHEDSYEEMAKFLNHDTQHKDPIHFDPTWPKFMQAYLDILHRNLEKIACDFWWIDWQQGAHTKIPGLDPLWLLNHFHFLDNAISPAAAATKPLIFSRYAGPGSHRYPVGFSGDTVISWPSLQFQPEFTNTASNIGYGWWSHDIGGHMLGGRDDELTARWVQYGVFSPIMRLHSSNSQWTSKEPWCYRKECEEIISKYLQLRHRLVPYLYSRNVTGADSDDPICQPMYWHFPETNQAYEVPNQYFFGFELIVAPITSPRDKETNLASVKAWLPPLGKHVDIFTGTVYDGDREISLYRPLAEYPVLAHEGSIIPLDAAPAPENGCKNPTAFEVLVVVGKNGQASVLEDPADDADQTKKEAPSTGERGALIQYTQETGKLVAHVTGRTWTFRFLALTSVPKDLKVMVNGTDRTSDAKVAIESYPDTPSMVVHVPFVADAEKVDIEIDLGKDPQLGVVDQTKRIRDLLNDYQTPFDLKDRLWAIATDKKSSVGVKVGKVLALGAREECVGPVLELLVADGRS